MLPRRAAIIDLPTHTLLPGLVDCHAHLIGEPDSGHGYAELLTRSSADEAFSGVRNARDTVLAGFTVCATSGRSARSSTWRCATRSTKAW